MLPKQKFNFKYVFIVFIAAAFAGTTVLIVTHYVNKEMEALSVYSGLNLQSAKDIAKDWQTYQSEKYGFEIKYPQGWNIKINLQHRLLDIPDIYLSNNSLGLNIFIKPKAVGFEGDENRETIKEETIQLGSATLYKSTLRDISRGVYWIEALILNNSDNYYIFSNYSSKQNQLDKYNQILSTFKFIK